MSVFLAMRGVVAEAGQGLGSPASGRLLRSAPDQPCTGTGLPLARRLINLYHPYDPVGHRLEPLAYGIADAPPKAQYAALSGGSKRLHIGIQELGEDVSSAASRWGASLKWTLSFGQRGGEGPEAAAAEAVARRDLDEGLLQAIESETSLTFGSPSEQGAALGLGASPPRRLGVGGDAGLGSRPASPTRVPRPPSSADLEQKLAREAVAALAGGPLPEAGKRVGAGRIDFALQVISGVLIRVLVLVLLAWSWYIVAYRFNAFRSGASVLTTTPTRDLTHTRRSTGVHAVEPVPLGALGALSVLVEPGRGAAAPEGRAWARPAHRRGARRKGNGRGGLRRPGIFRTAEAVVAVQ